MFGRTLGGDEALCPAFLALRPQLLPQPIGEIVEQEHPGTPDLRPGQLTGCCHLLRGGFAHLQEVGSLAEVEGAVRADSLAGRMSPIEYEETVLNETVH